MSTEWQQHSSRLLWLVLSCAIDFICCFSYWRFPETMVGSAMSPESSFLCLILAHILFLHEVFLGIWKLSWWLKLWLSSSKGLCLLACPLGKCAQEASQSCRGTAPVYIWWRCAYSLSTNYLYLPPGMSGLNSKTLFQGRKVKLIVLYLFMKKKNPRVFPFLAPTKWHIGKFCGSLWQTWPVWD